jgi:radical SAM superfamily enzyme YgiQ (UPF0313 family)
MVDAGLDLIWGCNSRIDTVSEEMLKKMKAAGCIRIDYGVESGSDTVLAALKKGVTVAQTREAIALTKKMGIRVGASFMLGNPDETLEEMEKTFKLAKEIAAHYTVFFYTTPFPGTELWDIAQAKHWIDQRPAFSEAWAFRESEFPAMRSELTKDELQSMRAKMQNAFFIRNYMHFSNIKIILIMIWLMIINPTITFGLIFSIFKLKRIDSLAENFLTRYRLKKISSSGR